MNKIPMLAALATMSLLLGGCRVVKVDTRGEEIARDKDGNPVLLDGKIQTARKGWEVYHNQHWMVTEADSLTATVKPDDIAFALNGLNSHPDGTNLVALVSSSMEGAATLAAKIGAAIATGGGSTAAEGGASAVVALAKQACALFTSKGGDATKASVSTASDGTVTVTDGSNTVTCKDGECTYSATSATD